MRTPGVQDSGGKFKQKSITEFILSSHSTSIHKKWSFWLIFLSILLTLYVFAYSRTRSLTTTSALKSQRDLTPVADSGQKISGVSHVALTGLRTTGALPKFLPYNLPLHDLAHTSSGQNKVLYSDFRKLKNCVAGHGFHVILMFFIGSSQTKYSSFKHSELKSRDKEYMEALQSNLNHPCVDKIHLFYVNNRHLNVVLAANLSNVNKLQPVKTSRLIHMADFYIYASRYLIGKAVIALNADIILGEGFHLIDTTLLSTKKHLYCLSRYVSNCTHGSTMCNKKIYQGSHDTHVFSLNEPLSENILARKLNYPINMAQAENGMISTMRQMFHFKVSNPCFTLKTYHHHCSGVTISNPNYTIHNFGWQASDTKGGGIAWPKLL